ncbi:MAG: DNA translocase FtsK, partial [Caldilineae bacterium]
MITMREEAMLIDRVFAQHGVDCRVQPPPGSYETATMRLYGLQRGRGVPVSKVSGLVEELDEALTQARRTPVRCRVDRLPLRLETPRPDPRPLKLEGALARLKPSDHTQGRLLALAGEGHAYRRREALLLDFTSPNTPHALIAGATGSGKTNLLVGLTLSLATLHSPQELALALLDPKGVDLVGLAALPHLALPIITDPAEALLALQAVVTELERRKQQLGAGQNLGRKEDLPRLVLVIDELAELADVGGKEVEACVKRILQVGRGLGIHVIGATQKPLAAVIGSLVKANFPVRLVGKVASTDDARVAAGVSGTGAERLPGRGAFLLLQGGDMRRIQAYLAPADLSAHALDLRRRWQGVDTTWRLPRPSQAPAPRAVIRTPTANGVAPQWLRRAVERYLAEHGKLPSQRAVQRTYQ